jgi:ATP-binding protein involved in chromosome partitioning
VIGLAAAFARAGRRVALLDIDIRAPNLTYMLGLPSTSEAARTGHPLPARAVLDGHAVEVFSPAMVFRDGGSIIMGGRQMRQMVIDMIHDVVWSEPDVMVVDVDPSSGDSIQAVAATLRRVSAVIVATPDRSALEDCRRMADACVTLGIRVAGVVGNMVGAVCWNCEKPLHCQECGAPPGRPGEEEIEDLARQVEAPVLGYLPRDENFRESPGTTVTRPQYRNVFDRAAAEALRWE